GGFQRDRGRDEKQEFKDLVHCKSLQLLDPVAKSPDETVQIFGCGSTGSQAGSNLLIGNPAEILYQPPDLINHNIRSYFVPVLTYKSPVKGTISFVFDKIACLSCESIAIPFLPGEGPAPFT